MVAARRARPPGAKGTHVIEDEGINRLLDETGVRVEQATAAVSRQVYASPRNGSEEFDRFTDAVMARALDDYDGRRDGRVSPMGFLHRPEELRVYEPDDGETVREFFVRLQSEAAAMGATWFGTAMACPSAPAVVDVDPHDQQSIDAAKERGELSSNLCWQVESIEEGFRTTRCGMWLIDAADGHLLPMLEADPRSAADLFRMVLNPTRS